MESFLSDLTENVTHSPCHTWVFGNIKHHFIYNHTLTNVIKTDYKVTFCISNMIRALNPCPESLGLKMIWRKESNKHISLFSVYNKISESK
jgi:hypothetical protein